MNQIKRRRETSGGQAIVLVTLALLGMCGMMGLAVDMGWSFFVHKQAQTAADAAALGAVQEAITRISGNGVVVSAFDCTSAGTGATQADCQTTPVACGSVAASSNLNNGCQYALKNGFDWTTSRQNVTMQSNDGLVGDLPPTAPGVLNITYWVTARTVQTVPQLFSAVISRTEGTVSAVATAAIAASIGPGQFYGMNRAGDCTGWTGSAGKLVGGDNCGIDYIGAPGGGKQTNCGTGKANLCAPAGIILASNCAAKQKGVCDDGVAGDGDAMGSSLTIMGNGKGGGGAVSGSWNNMSGSALTPLYSNAAQTFKDPTAPNPQPPLVSELSSGAKIAACGYANGVVPSGANLGPYQYYAYDSSTGLINGRQLTFSGNVTFSAGGGCPGGTLSTNGATSQGGSQFPTYIFYGGVNAGGSTMTMGAGQYVMAGTNTKVGGNDIVFQEFGANITGDQNTGTMFIYTDGNYPGLSNQLSLIASNTGKSIATIQNLNQGSLSIKNGSMDLSGLIGSSNTGSNLPPELNAYSGIVMWQDRRNSDVGYNQAFGTTGCPDCTDDDGSVIVCADNGDCANRDSAKLATLLAANHVTATSPGLVMDPGNGNFALNGVFYQPRGAWMDFVAGNVGFTCTLSQGGGPNSQCPLQVITGALFEDHGTASLNLAGPTNPIITYKPVLIH